MPGRPTVIVVMGVAGAGKTTVGRALAEALGWAFYDGDDFHPSANVATMRRGVALTDADRTPWLAALRDLIAGCLAAGTPTVLACSALRARYRKELVPAGTVPGAVRFVYLRATRGVAGQRLRERTGHFMPATLLESQFDTLEEPIEADACWVDAALPVTAIVGQIRDVLARTAPPHTHTMDILSEEPVHDDPQHA